MRKEIDNNLLQSCIKQNRTAQKELYMTLLPYLRTVANRYLRDTSYEKDALQEGFVKIFKNLSKYDPSKAPLKSWSARIIINTCLNYNTRVIGVPNEEINLDKFDTPDTHTGSWDNFSDDYLLGILKKMPKGYFEVFNLFVIDGYSHKEITEILQITEAVSRKKLSRAKNWLRNSRELLSYQ